MHNDDPRKLRPKGMIFQVSDARKPLMSVGSMADAPCSCLFPKTGGSMRDVDSSEIIPLTRRGKLYHVRAWMKAANRPPFWRARLLVHSEHADSVRPLDSASGVGEATRNGEASSSATVEGWVKGGEEESQEETRKPKAAECSMTVHAHRCRS